jgi:hypothetical protein
MILRQDLAGYRQEIAEVLNKHFDGRLHFTLPGTISFSQNDFKTKIEAVVINSSGETFDKCRENFENYALAFGFDKKWYREIVRYFGKEYRLLDIHPRKRKFPIIVEDIATGKKYKFPANGIKEAAESQLK